MILVGLKKEEGNSVSLQSLFLRWMPARTTGLPVLVFPVESALSVVHFG